MSALWLAGDPLLQAPLVGPYFLPHAPEAGSLSDLPTPIPLLDEASLGQAPVSERSLILFRSRNAGIGRYGCIPTEFPKTPPGFLRTLRASHREHGLDQLEEVALVLKPSTSRPTVTVTPSGE